MDAADRINLLFGGMTKLAPGADDETLQVLHRLPQRRFDVIVDAGCGTGRQTIALARELDTLVHAVDSHQPFLDDLVRFAGDAPIEVHCMDMQDIPQRFQNIYLLWSEGAAYSIGFANALATWAPALRPGAFAVVSERS